MPPEIQVSPDSNALALAAAELFIEIGNEAIAERNRFATALSGGSTPKLLFQTLAGEDFRGRIDWSKTFFFFGDERHVAPDAADSNYRTARQNLFEPLAVPAENVYRWRAEWKNAEEAALDYEKTLKEFFAVEMPRFDLIMLGMGADGHTASLFPGTAALTEKNKLAAANWVEKLQSFRLTFTFPLINNAANVVFLVGGADKAETLKTVLEGESEPSKFPSQAVKPVKGKFLWLVEKDAARLLGDN